MWAGSKLLCFMLTVFLSEIQPVPNSVAPALSGFTETQTIFYRPYAFIRFYSIEDCCIKQCPYPLDSCFSTLTTPAFTLVFLLYIYSDYL